MRRRSDSIADRLLGKIQRIIVEILTADAMEALAEASWDVASQDHQLAVIDHRAVPPTLGWHLSLSLLHHPLGALELVARPCLEEQFRGETGDGIAL